MGPQLVRCGMKSGKYDPRRKHCLQWGRNLFVAECKGGRHEAKQGGQPSMGPQLVRCGMNHAAIPITDMPPSPSMGPQLVRCGMQTATKKSRRFLSLQWGRNLFVAECRRQQRYDRTHPDTLQWGRNLFVAECGRRPRERRRRRPPSMGPQLVRCGMQAA